ncbi:MAG: ribokinase [Oscillibacter sp.]|jgi:ribokinase|nr:ribokinase [Oscillibacter sp.]
MTRKPKILVAGSFVMDLIATTDHAPTAGQTVIGKTFRTAPGGKGANQAVQASRLGADVTMIGCVGGDIFGQEMLDTASKAGVDVSHVKIDRSISSGIGHVLLEVTEHGAQNRITAIPGANQSIKLEDVAWVKDCIGQYDLVMLQMEIPLEINLLIAHWAKDAGIPVMLNPAPAAALSDELLSCVTYLTPNEQEASVETGCPLRIGQHGIQKDDMRAVAAALWAKGVQNVIITLGSNGSAVVGEDKIQYIPCVEMSHVADPTAAGDSFVAAFCVGLGVGLSQPQALSFASHTAAITVSRMGAMPSLPTLSEVKALLQERACTDFALSQLDVLG